MPGGSESWIRRCIRARRKKKKLGSQSEVQMIESGTAAEWQMVFRLNGSGAGSATPQGIIALTPFI